MNICTPASDNFVRSGHGHLFAAGVQFNLIQSFLISIDCMQPIPGSFKSQLISGAILPTAQNFSQNRIWSSYTSISSFFESLKFVFPYMSIPVLQFI